MFLTCGLYAKMSRCSTVPRQEFDAMFNFFRKSWDSVFYNALQQNWNSSKKLKIQGYKIKRRLFKNSHSYSPSNLSGHPIPRKMTITGISNRGIFVQPFGIPVPGIFEKISVSRGFRRPGKITIFFPGIPKITKNPDICI